MMSQQRGQDRVRGEDVEFRVGLGVSFRTIGGGHSKEDPVGFLLHVNVIDRYRSTRDLRRKHYKHKDRY